MKKESDSPTLPPFQPGCIRSHWKTHSKVWCGPLPRGLWWLGEDSRSSIPRFSSYSWSKIWVRELSSFMCQKSLSSGLKFWTGLKIIVQFSTWSEINRVGIFPILSWSKCPSYGTSNLLCYVQLQVPGHVVSVTLSTMTGNGNFPSGMGSNILVTV